MYNMETVDLREEVYGEVHAMTPSWWTIWGIFFVFGFTVVLFFLSYFIKYPDVIVASARFVSEVPSVTIPSKVSSRIALLNKSHGDPVRKNDYIIIFTDNGHYKDVLRLKQRIDGLDLNSDLIHFFREELKYDYQLGDLIQSTWNSLNFFLLEKYQIESQQKYDFEVLRLEKELLYQKRISFKFKRLRNLDEKLLGIWEQKRNVDSILATGEVISKVEHSERLIRQLETKKNSTQEDLAFEKSRLDITRIENSIESLKQSRNERLTELRLNIKKALLDVKLAINNWEENYVVKSPISGKLHHLVPLKENQFIKLNDDLVAITPDTLIFRVELKIPFSGAGKLRTGQKVNIKLNDYPYTEFGVLTGTVSALSEVASQDHYTGLVSLDRLSSTTTYNRTIHVHENASATAEIITQDRSWLGRLFEKVLYIMTV
jgi:hypothetical protein